MAKAQNIASRSGHTALVAVAFAIIVACFSHVPAAHAATMCMATDTIAIILDPDIEPTNYTYTAGEWSVTAPYGNLSGIATCNSTSGSYGVAYPQYEFEQGTSGVYCWCRMLRPARSAWVCLNAYSSASDCASYCASNCGNRVRFYADFRGGVFGSAGN